MQRINIVIYEDKYRLDLERLLKDFSIETWDNDGSNVNVDSFIDGHWAIYLALVNGVVVGLNSYYLNDYFGLRDTVLSNTYIYIMKEYRTSRIMHLFSIQSGKICTEYNMPLEHHYSSLHSSKLSKKLNGHKIYETWIYSVDEVNKTFNRLKDKVRIEQ